ncbi:MAG: GTP 3',8-cyclase MoaA [Anaerococcus sp.]|nr:GTP 3',8-cyclase MoaA [Anaerococcus sp.]
MKDSFDRTIDYLRISVTDLCNFRCKYCMPDEGIQKIDKDQILSLEEIYYIAHIFIEEGVRKIRLSGGEPLVRPGLLHLVKSLGKITKLKDLAMTTNGSLLKENARSLRAFGLKRVNISLDSLKAEKFRKIGGGDLKKVLEGIEESLDLGLGVKINTVLLKGVNDDEVVDFINLTKKYPIDVRFIEVMPIGPTANYAKDKFLRAEEIISSYGLKEVSKDDKSSPARLFKLDKALGRVGFIEPMTHKFCGDCNRVRLTSDGFLKPCLHSDRLIDLKTPLRKGHDIRPVIKEALEVKPFDHKLLEGKIIKSSMNRIGG